MCDNGSTLRNDSPGSEKSESVITAQVLEKDKFCAVGCSLHVFADGTSIQMTSPTISRASFDNDWRTSVPSTTLPMQKGLNRGYLCMNATIHTLTCSTVRTIAAPTRSPLRTRCLHRKPIDNLLAYILRIRSHLRYSGTPLCFSTPGQHTPVNHAPLKAEGCALFRSIERSRMRTGVYIIHSDIEHEPRVQPRGRQKPLTRIYACFRASSRAGTITPDHAEVTRLHRCEREEKAPLVQAVRVRSCPFAAAHIRA